MKQRIIFVLATAFGLLVFSDHRLFPRGSLFFEMFHVIADVCAVITVLVFSIIILLKIRQSPYECFNYRTNRKDLTWQP
jgi:hypothetical protein